MIEAGGRVKFEVTGEDLVNFADRLIEKAQEMKAHELQQQQDVEETWLTKAQAAEMCKVSQTTLWSWDKSGYLKPSKVGKRCMYALSDIRRLLSSKNRPKE